MNDLPESSPSAPPLSESLAASPISEELRSQTAEAHARQVERMVPTCCRFHLGGQDYYLRIEYMIEISDYQDVTAVPLAPPYLRGLVNLRGDAIPVIDMARLKGTIVPPGPDQRLIITDAGGERIAFLVEGIPSLSKDMEGEEVDVVHLVQNFKVGVS